MEYYLSDYLVDSEGRRVPRIAKGSFTSINIQDKAIVALPGRSDGPGRTHLCSCAKDRSTTPYKLLGRAFSISLGGDCLANALAELLLYHIPPGLRPHSPRVAHTGGNPPEDRYQIWLGNECIWSKPCMRGGSVDPVRSDDFDRPDEVPLTTGVGPNDRWDVATGRELPELRRTDPTDDTTGLVKARWGINPDPFRHRAAKWNNINTPFTGNHSAQIGSIGLYSTVGPTVRHQAGADTFYHPYYFQNNPVDNTQDLYLSKFLAGVETVLASTLGITTDVFGVSTGTIRGEASGSTLTVKFLGTGYPIMVTVFTVTDTAITGGQPGFDISSRPSGVLGGAQDQDADNFQCDGDVDGAQFGQPIDC